MPSPPHGTDCCINTSCAQNPDPMGHQKQRLQLRDLLRPSGVWCRSRKGTDGRSATARQFPMAHFDAATRRRTASGRLNPGIRFVDIRKPRDLRGLGTKPTPPSDHTPLGRRCASCRSAPWSAWKGQSTADGRPLNRTSRPFVCPLRHTAAPMRPIGRQIQREFVGPLRPS
jgi:hypothetical protein